jgi:hypothetical protein
MTDHQYAVAIPESWPVFFQAPNHLETLTSMFCCTVNQNHMFMSDQDTTPVLTGDILQKKNQHKLKGN